MQYHSSSLHCTQTDTYTFSRSQNFLGRQAHPGVCDPLLDCMQYMTISPSELTHYQLQRYMRSFASFHGINSNDNNPNTSYNTRVELVEKRFDDDEQEQGWRLTLKKLVKTAEGKSKATWWTEVGLFIDS